MRAMLLGAALLLACGGGGEKKTPEPTHVPPPATEPGPPRPSEEAPVPEAPPDEGTGPFKNLPGGGFMPPPAAGQSRTSFSGCLEASKDEAAGARFPVTRGETGPEVRVTALGNGVIVAHELTHACCLGGAVEAKVEGKKIHVVETLSGTPCRCTCRSTIKTAVGLEPGDYTLDVELHQGDEQDRVHEGPVKVQSLRAPGGNP
jgi:hypothetical protein